MENAIDKLGISLKQSDTSLRKYKLIQNGEEQEDGSVLVRFFAVLESGESIPIPIRWHMDAKLDVVRY
jgi:hypothetical protein